MSMELPVVATKSGGMEEVITHGKNGLLADIYDEKVLAGNLQGLLKSENFRLLLGKAARIRIVEDFDLVQQIDRFEEVYKQLNNYPVKKEFNTVATPQLNTPLIHRFNKSNNRLRIGIIVSHFPLYTETFFITK